MVASIVALTVPTVVVISLGWMLVRQDRELANRRASERPAAATELAANALTQAVRSVHLQLETLLEAERPRAALTPADGRNAAVYAVFEPAAIWTSTPLPFYPLRNEFAGPADDPVADRFIEGERREYGDDPGSALLTFQRLADNPDRVVRAGALARIARVARTLRHHAEALDAYGRLATLGSTPALGRPADLLAATERCDVLAELGSTDELAAAARSLDQDLVAGRWRLSRTEFAFYRSEIEGLVGPVNPEPARTPVTLATGVSKAATAATIGSGTESLGQFLFDADHESGVVVWRRQGDRIATFVATAAFVRDEWLPELAAIETVQAVRLTVADTAGRAWFGSAPSDSSSVFQVPGTPFTLSATAADAAEGQAAARRRYLLIGVVVALSALLLVGGYLSARGIARELAAARLQSDFVAAVSHEFRTPVASVRQLTELLDEGRVPNESRRTEYYGLLRHESERLQRLVENLLDFGRMEASAVEYRMETAEAGALVREVSAAFSAEVAINSRRVVVDVAGDLPPVRLDREAIGRALWNLLDNAAKYSPEDTPIAVKAARDTDGIDISVRNEGAGIPLEEQPSIFDRFVRGARAKSSGTKGTGLGLAMVKHIVTAHRGTVSVDSAPDAGATFTIHLPAEAAE